MFPEISRLSNDRRTPVGRHLSPECSHLSRRLRVSLDSNSLEVTTIGDVLISPWEGAPKLTDCRILGERSSSGGTEGVRDVSFHTESCFPVIPTTLVGISTGQLVLEIADLDLSLVSPSCVCDPEADGLTRCLAGILSPHTRNPEMESEPISGNLSEIPTSP